MPRRWPVVLSLHLASLVAALLLWQGLALSTAAGMGLALMAALSLLMLAALFSLGFLWGRRSRPSAA